MENKFAVKFQVRNSNELIFDCTLTSLSEVLNLTLEDKPEVKLIKHILRNDLVIGPNFLSLMKSGIKL